MKTTLENAYRLLGILHDLDPYEWEDVADGVDLEQEAREIADDPEPIISHLCDLVAEW